MTNYVALLRGINVGGNNIIRMDALRAEFTRMGFTAVRSYIQSGNVLFASPVANQTKIEKNIEAALSRAFNYQAKVLIRSEQQLAQTVASFPKIFGDTDWKHNVIFLRPAIDSAEILQRFAVKKEIETITYTPGILFWSAKLATITRSTMLKLSSKKEYQEMTVRNINTTKKLLELMRK